MARLFDKIIVVDLEATCWSTTQYPYRTQDYSNQTEIIEIGICALNLDNGNISTPESILVRPLFSTCSEYCTELTTLTQDKLMNEGVEYKDALERIKKYRPKNRIWASWGDYDRVQFERNCALYKERYFEVTSRMPAESDYKYPFGRSHLNISDLYSVMNRLNKRIGFQRALKQLDIKFEGTPHRGVDDAYNIARVLKILLDRSKKLVLPEMGNFFLTPVEISHRRSK